MWEKVHAEEQASLSRARGCEPPTLFSFDCWGVLCLCRCEFGMCVAGGRVCAFVCVYVCVYRIDVEWALCECYVGVCKICVCSGGQMHVLVCGRLMCL